VAVAAEDHTEAAEAEEDNLFFPSSKKIHIKTYPNEKNIIPIYHRTNC
jgi:hypothetical protein